MSRVASRLPEIELKDLLLKTIIYKLKLVVWRPASSALHSVLRKGNSREISAYEISSIIKIQKKDTFLTQDT